MYSTGTLSPLGPEGPYSSIPSWPFVYKVIKVQGSQGSLLFVTYTIIQGIIGSEMLVRTGPLNGKCKKEKIKHDNK